VRILITGGGGFIGKKLAARLLERGHLLGKDIEKLVLFDVVDAEGLPADPRLDIRSGDIASKAVVDKLVESGFDAVYHLAAVVSAGAEADFDLGMSVNLGGTRQVLEALRRHGGRPRLVFASSCAVFGGELPEVVTDTWHLTPQSSYGIQKAASELLVGDYSRKGFIDGRSLRLPTIFVRPGKPNKAASTFASSIVREPLAGVEAICPVTAETGMYILSPRRVVDALVHAIELADERFGMVRSLTLPGITMTVGGTIAALERVAGKKVVDRIRFQPDPVIQHIVSGWPARFEAKRGLAMGFEADRDLEEIIRQHIEDERGGQIA
jgi:nucleoside-diphosphate-sugar epimerase